MVSLLDIIGPVMVGPSSSHTAGACRIGLLARALGGGTPEKTNNELHGSLGRPAEAHGTRKRLEGGVKRANLDLKRKQRGGDAFMVLELDEPPKANVMDQVRGLTWVKWAVALDKVSA